MAATRGVGSGAPELRKDKVNGRWVIFSPARSRRPSDLKSASPAVPNSGQRPQECCPFCIGQEHLCAPEIFRYPQDSVSDWTVRVIQNLYPALSRDLGQPPSPNPSPADDHPPYAALPGFGFHDVVIESPRHFVHLSDLSPPEVGQVLHAHKTRIVQLALNQNIKYVQVFKNHGASAGASMSHSHSQIMALPVVPFNVTARLDSMKDYFTQTGKCSLCEVPAADLVIDESTHFISIAPFAAAYPFEIWIIPWDHAAHFHELDDQKVADLGGLLKLMIQKMSRQLNNPPFNFMIQSSPLRIESSELPYVHWFLQIVPQLTRVAGFEMATGCYINPVFPEDAAKILRELEL